MADGYRHRRCTHRQHWNRRWRTGVADSLSTDGGRIRRDPTRERVTFDRVLVSRQAGQAILRFEVGPANDGGASLTTP